MSNGLDERLSRLRSEVAFRRAFWYDVRSKIRLRKNELLTMGFEKSVVRKDREYKRLQKQRKCLSKEIRHLEQKINRTIARQEKKDSNKE